MVNAGVIHGCFSLDCINAEGFGNIAPLFQDLYSFPTYQCVICVYDVDCRQLDSISPYQMTKAKLEMVLGSEASVRKVSFCTNPNFLQIYLLAKDELSNVRLTSTSKETNSPLVHSYWPEIGREVHHAKGKISTKHYDAISWQLRIMNGMFYSGKDAYTPLLEHCRELSADYIHDCPGSNVPLLIRALLDGDVGFFEAIMEDL